jgi:hypothetical protein
MITRRLDRMTRDQPARASGQDTPGVNHMLRTRLGCPIAGALVAIVVLIPGVARAAGWLTAAPLNATNGSLPSVAIDSPGNTTVVWQANPGGGTAVVQGAQHVVGTPGFSALADFSTDP